MRGAVVGLMAGHFVFLGAWSATAQLPGMCLDAELGPWHPVEESRANPLLHRPPPDVSADSLFYTTPLRVELTSQEAPGGSAYVVEIPDNALSTPHSQRAWWVRADSLFLSFSTGFVGVRIRSRRVGDEWVGSLRMDSDVEGFLRYERGIRLRAADCSSPPPARAADDRRLPRIVELDNGISLELAKPLPSTLETEVRRSGHLTVLAQPSGRFLGADTVIVRVTRAGVVASIALRYRFTFDVEDLMQRLGNDFGMGKRFERARGVVWRNRSTTISVFSAPAEGLLHRVSIIDPRQGR